VDETPIKITNADTVITARLADNATARGLAGEPPLTMTVKDFNHVDKLRDFLGGCLQTAHQQEPTQTLAISATTQPWAIWCSTTPTSATGMASSHRPIPHHDGADRATRRQLPGHHRIQLIARRAVTIDLQGRGRDLQLDAGRTCREPHS
jgi:hypothetical protein